MPSLFGDALQNRSLATDKLEATFLTDFTNAINSNIATLKNELDKVIGKQIQENNAKLSYFFLKATKVFSELIYELLSLINSNSGNCKTL